MNQELQDVGEHQGPPDNLIDLDSRRPHVTIVAGRRVHVIPLSVLERIARMEIPITDLDDWQEIIPVIVGGWIEMGKRVSR